MDIRSLNIGLEVYTIALLAVLILSQMMRMRRDRSSRLFSWMMLAYALAVGGNLLSWMYLDFAGDAGMFARAAGATAAYIFGMAAYPMYACYLFILIRDLYHVREVPKIWGSAILLISEGGILLTLLNPLTHWLFDIPGPGQWKQGPLGYLMELAAATEMAILLVWVCMMKGIRFQTKLRAALFGGLIIFAAVLDACFPGVTLIYPLTAFSFLLCYVNLQLRGESENIVLRLRLADERANFLLGQIKPHMIFNSLNTIYYLCGQDAKTAQWAVGEFSEFLRSNLDNFSANAPVSLSREMEYVRHYVSLEQLRYGKRLSVEYDLETLDFSVPPLTIQPLVENAIAHGIAPREEGGHVIIRTRQYPDFFEVMVEDDGVGFDASYLQEEKEPLQISRSLEDMIDREDTDKKHIGLANIRERIGLMQGASLWVESSTDEALGTGTKAYIRIPKKSVEK